MRLALAAVLLPLAACSQADAGSGIPSAGTGPSRHYAVADFNAVAATGPDDVDVRTGAGFSVRAEGNPAVLDHLRVRRAGNTLRIDRQPGWHPTVSGSAKVFVTMPRIAEADVTGSGSIVVDKVAGGGFNGDTTGSGDLTVHSLSVDALALSLTGSGDVAVSGRARNLTVSVAGSGSVDGAGLVAGGGSVDVAGSGGVRARVEGAASVSVMGSGSVDLGPRARCTVSKMGSGSVTCGH